MALEYRQITPIRRTGSLDTSRQRNGPVSGHVSGTYPLIPAYQDLGFATTADAGGSNGYRTRGWKTALQQLADDLGLCIPVSHFPPGTSKWNKIEHRLFCHITENWRGRPLRTFETIVDLIGHTRTATGLRVKAKLDKRRYKTGLVVTTAEMRRLALHPHPFHGDWNYELRPRPS